MSCWMLSRSLLFMGCALLLAVHVSVGSRFRRHASSPHDHEEVLEEVSL